MCTGSGNNTCWDRGSLYHLIPLRRFFFVSEQSVFHPDNRSKEKQHEYSATRPCVRTLPFMTFCKSTDSCIVASMKRVLQMHCCFRSQDRADRFEACNPFKACNPCSTRHFQMQSGHTLSLHVALLHRVQPAPRSSNLLWKVHWCSSCDTSSNQHVHATSDVSETVIPCQPT